MKWKVFQKNTEVALCHPFLYCTCKRQTRHTFSNVMLCSRGSANGHAIVPLTTKGKFEAGTHELTKILQACSQRPVSCLGRRLPPRGPHQLLCFGTGFNFCAPAPGWTLACDNLLNISCDICFCFYPALHQMTPSHPPLLSRLKMGVPLYFIQWLICLNWVMEGHYCCM